MPERSSQPDPIACGATAVITHLVQPGREADYERWLEEIGPVVRAWPGYLDLDLIRPIEGITRTFVVVLRFADRDHLERWLASDQRRELIDRVRPVLEKEDRFHIRSGLDFWFVPEGAQAQLPVRWKQALATWAVIYPLVSIVPLLVVPLLDALHVPAWRPLQTLVITFGIVNLMVYVVMPRVTRLLSRWLFA